MAVVLCRGAGKRSFVFPGLKKSKRRTQAAGDPGTAISITCRELGSKDFVTARDFSVIKYFAGIRANFAKIACAAFLLELTESTTAFAQRDDGVFELLAAALATLENTEWVTGLAAFFAVHLIRLQGILSAPEEIYPENVSFILAAMQTKFVRLNPDDWNGEYVLALLDRLTSVVKQYFGSEVKSFDIFAAHCRKSTKQNNC